MAVSPLFATKASKGGGVGKKVYQVVNIFSWISLGALDEFSELPVIP